MNNFRHLLNASDLALHDELTRKADEQLSEAKSLHAESVEMNERAADNYCRASAIINKEMIRRANEAAQWEAAVRDGLIKPVSP